MSAWPLDPVLVTGAAGFVGACAVRRLLSRGHEVHAVLRPRSDPWRLSGLEDRIVLHRLDLGRAASLRRLLETIRPQAVIHLAAHGAYPHQTDFAAMVRAGVLGTHHLLESSATVGVRVFVAAGSSSEYGYKSAPMSEADRLEPNSRYSVAKAAQTHLCSLAGKGSGMGVAVFRLFSVYGPWEAPGRLIPTLLRRARAGLPLDMVVPEVARDFVYVEDVLDALLDLPRVLEMRGEVLNLGTGVQTSLRTVTDLVVELTRSRSEVRWGVMAPRPWDTDCWVADCSRAAARLGWRPAHDLRQGLAATAAWMEGAGDADALRDYRAAG
jgi:dolichol-phosphate mannosyltransferase